MSQNRRTEAGSRWPQEVRLAQLVADALRLRIVIECNARETSPRGFHERVGGATLAKLTEAFELLAHYEWLEPTRGEGAERFYRGTGPALLTAEAFERLPGSTKALADSRFFESLAARAREAMKAGTTSARPDAHLTWTPLEFDRQGWEELTAHLDAAFAELDGIRERAQARMEETGEEPIPATVALLGFESPKDPERKFS